MMVHTYNPSSQEAEAGEQYFWEWEFNLVQAILGCIERPCLKRKKKKK